MGYYRLNVLKNTLFLQHHQPEACIMYKPVTGSFGRVARQSSAKASTAVRVR